MIAADVAGKIFRNSIVWLLKHPPQLVHYDIMLLNFPNIKPYISDPNEESKL